MIYDLTGLSSILTALSSILAGSVILFRLWKWRVWIVADVLNLTSLHLGYAMLEIGMILNAVLLITQENSGLIGFHGVLIGGFAVLSTSVMCRTVLQRLRFNLSLPVAMRISTICLLTSAFTRMVAMSEMLMVSAVLWEIAFLCFVGTLIFIVWRFQHPR